jgi:hypothetical protein
MSDQPSSPATSVTPDRQPGQGTWTPKRYTDPADHPFTEMIREFLRSIGLKPEALESEADDGIISWQFETESRMAVRIGIWRDDDGELFLLLDARTSRMDPYMEHLVLRTLANHNGTLHLPFRLGVIQDFVTVQFQVYCDGITAEHLKVRLESLLPFAAEVQDMLYRDFGLRPAVGKRNIIPK